MDEEAQLFANELATTLATLTSERDDALRGVKEIQIGLHSLLQQEALSQRSRGREDRARALEARAGSTLPVIASLESERQRLRIVVPEVPEKGTLVHGRVQDPSGGGIAGLTVSLVDANDRPLPGVAPATTDESGYYAFVLGPNERGDHAPPASIAVSSPRGRLLHRERQPLEVSTEGRTAVDVVLDPGDLAEERARRPGSGRKPGTVPEE